MNTDRKPTINTNLDQSFYDGYSFLAPPAELDFSFYNEDELTNEQLALKRLQQSLRLNNQCQERLKELLQNIATKIEKNNQKLEKVNEIIAFKNKRNKIQLKKKQIDFYKFEDPKLPPESFRIFERVRQSKGKKEFPNLYKTLIEDSSSDEEGDDEEKPWTSQEDEGYSQDNIKVSQEKVIEITTKKEVEEKTAKKQAKKNSHNKRASKKAIKVESTREESKGEMINEDDEEDNEGDYEDDPDQESDSDDEMRFMKERGDRLGLDAFLEEHKEKDPRDIDWLAVARKANSRSLSREKNSLVTALDLYRRFISPEIQKKRSQWTQEEDRALSNAVKIHGTNNWKQVANNIEGKNTYLCFQRWAKFVNPEIAKGRWNLEEDLKLCLAVESFKVGNWIGVASLFRNRTDVQCRERWCNILDPKLNGREWTKEEDELLVKAVMDHGKKWAKVSRMMKNRTDNQCWRRWKIISRKPAKNSRNSLEDKRLGALEIKNIKINMNEPFLIKSKKVKREGIMNQESEMAGLSSVKTESNLMLKETVKKRAGRKRTVSKGKEKKEEIIEEL